VRFDCPSFFDGGISRAGDINVDDPVVQEAALKEKVQIVDISKARKARRLGHDQFVSVAVLYSRSHDQAARYRNTAAHSSLQMTMRRSCGHRHRKSGGCAMIGAPELRSGRDGCDRSIK